MTNPFIGDLFGNQVLQSNPLATVTPNCVVIRHSTLRSSTIISLSEVTRLKRVRTTYPAFLVLSSAFLLISAAAYYSKEGSGATVPTGLLGGGCALGYQMSRRTAVGFVIGNESLETESGSRAEADAVIAAVQSAQIRLQPTRK